MRIRGNTMASMAFRMYRINSDKMSKSMARLSSGFRINCAADDAAGLAISEKMRSQIRGLAMASNNAQNAISAIYIAEGALSETHAMLKRMKELAVNAATGTMSDTDRQQSANEFDQLLKEINDIAGQTNYNNMPLLDGSKSYEGPNGGNAANGNYAPLRIQVGALEGQQISIEILSMNTKGLGLDGVSLYDQNACGGAITAVDHALAMVSDQRSSLGAMQNRLEYKVNNLENTIANLSEAESRIRDTDIAKEMLEYTKYQILTQVATAMLAQANARAQSVLSLLQ